MNKNKKKSLSFEDYQKLKYPVGLDNVRLTCYMNAGLQSLFNTTVLTNYFITNENKIKSERSSLPFLLAYLEVVLYLARKKKGSKYISSYSPKKFFDIISKENEFQDYAGDSIDLIST